MAVDRSHNGPKKPGEGDRVGPANFDIEDLDSGAMDRRHPNDVFCRSDQTRSHALGVPTQPFEFRDPEGMVIGERSRPDEIGVECSQCRKKFFRTPDSCKSQEPRTGQPLPGDRLKHGGQDREVTWGLHPHAAARVTLGGEQYHRVGAAQATAKVLAQWTGRDYPPIAEAEGGVNDYQPERLGNRRILEPVIKQDRAGARGDGSADAGSTVAGNPARCAHRQQQRLIADGKRVVAAGIDPNRPAQPAAITPRHDVHRDAAPREPSGECQHNRRFTGAAGNEIADAHHRDRRAIGTRHYTAQPAGGIAGRADRRQQIGEEPGRLSPEDRGGAHSGLQPRVRTAL